MIIFSNWFLVKSIHFNFSEDILNYEIGDVDADDTDLTGADEDELLLSDDGKFVTGFSGRQMELIVSLSFQNWYQID